MDTHLPSRQGPTKAKQSTRVNLDPRVLELFVGLGAPSEENDVDEQLMDLLYFVVDILQFNKERNAYDEIDFDAVGQPHPLKDFDADCPLDRRGDSRRPASLPSGDQR